MPTAAGKGFHVAARIRRYPDVSGESVPRGCRSAAGGDRWGEASTKGSTAMKCTVRGAVMVALAIGAAFVVYRLRRLSR